MKKQTEQTTETISAEAHENKRNFILKCVAWGLAVVFLVTVILVVNLTGRRQKEGAAPDFTVNVLGSGEKFNLYDHDGEVVIIAFWDSASQESLTAVRDLVAAKNSYKKYAKNTFLAIHPSENTAGALSVIEKEGWDESGIVFARDTEENETFFLFGGTDIRPMTVYLNKNLAPVEKMEGVPEAEELYTKLNTAFLGGEEGYYCPDFTLYDYFVKEPFVLSEQRGKVSVVNFWTTYCTPCVNEMAEFEEIYKKYSGTVNVVAVHGSREAEDVPTFIQKQGWANFGVKFLKEGDSGLYDAIDGRASWPMTVVVDGNGFIVHKRLGSIEPATQPAHYNNLIAAIDRALNG